MIDSSDRIDDGILYTQGTSHLVRIRDNNKPGNHHTKLIRGDSSDVRRIDHRYPNNSDILGVCDMVHKSNSTHSIHGTFFRRNRNL